MTTETETPVTPETTDAPVTPASEATFEEREDADLTAGFEAGRTGQPIAEPETPVKSAEAAAELTPAAPAEPSAAAPAKVLAGMTEDEIKQVFAKVPGLEKQINDLLAVNGEVRRLSGIYGGINEEIKRLRQTSGQGPREIKAGDLDEEFVREYPEIAEMIARSFSKVLKTGAPAAPAAPADAAPAAAPNPAPMPGQLTQEQIDKLVDQRVETRIAQERENVQRERLTEQHPDWETVAKTPEFAKWEYDAQGNPVKLIGGWLSTLPEPDQKKYRESTSAKVAAEAFTKFKDFQAKAGRKRQVNKERLEQNLTPQGAGGAAPATTIDDEQAFVGGFQEANAGR